MLEKGFRILVRQMCESAWKWFFLEVSTRRSKVRRKRRVGSVGGGISETTSFKIYSDTSAESEQVAGDDKLMRGDGRWWATVDGWWIMVGGGLVVRGKLIGFWVEFQKFPRRKVAFDSLHTENHKFFSFKLLSHRPIYRISLTRVKIWAKSIFFSVFYLGKKSSFKVGSKWLRMLSYA